MDCTRVDDELVGFELGVIDGATRAAVEAHLVGCPRCVSAFLALKRAVDAGEEAEAPSEVTRARIRAEAHKALTTTAATTTTERKPKRAAWAAVAVAAAAMVLAPILWRTAHEPAATHAPGVQTQPAAVPAHEAVDTARTTPENLSFL